MKPKLKTYAARLSPFSCTLAAFEALADEGIALRGVEIIPMPLDDFTTYVVVVEKDRTRYLCETAQGALVLCGRADYDA